MTDFPEFLFKLGSPMGWDETYHYSKIKKDDFYALLSIHTYNNFKHFWFYDVLHGLTKLYLVRKTIQKRRAAIFDPKLKQELEKDKF